MKKWCKLLLLLICIQKCLFQSILFPHGYFDDKKLTAIDAFYLHMIAIATLENNGITEEELDNLAAIRKPSDSEIEEGQPDVKETKPNNTKISDLDDDEIKQLLNKQRPLIPGSKPKAPFKSRGKIHQFLILIYYFQFDERKNLMMKILIHSRILPLVLPQLLINKES